MRTDAGLADLYRTRISRAEPAQHAVLCFARDGFRNDQHAGNGWAARRAGVPPQLAADLVGARGIPARHRGRARSRQRDRPAHRRIRPPGAEHHLVAERPGRKPFAQHRGVAARRQARELAPAGAHRCVRSGLEAAAGARAVAKTSGNFLRQRPSHCAVARRRGSVCRRRAASMRNGRHTAPSNAAFDASLRSTNAEWGVRDAGDVAALAARNGLRMIDIVAMPANNLILIFAREQSPAAHS